LAQAKRKTAAKTSRAKSSQAAAAADISGLWWMWLAFGILWTAAAIVILQFDDASVKTIGIIVGIMFLVTAFQNMVLSALVDGGLRWLFGIFAFLFLLAGIWSIVNATEAFVAIVDVLGFLFVLVGVFWVIQAFAVREEGNELWWLGLVTGILLMVVGFWIGGQYFDEKARFLIAFAGIWALLSGITDLIRAFQIRKLGRLA